MKRMGMILAIAAFVAGLVGLAPSSSEAARRFKKFKLGKKHKSELLQCNGRYMAPSYFPVHSEINLTFTKSLKGAKQQPPPPRNCAWINRGFAKKGYGVMFLEVSDSGVGVWHYDYKKGAWRWSKASSTAKSVKYLLGYIKTKQMFYLRVVKPANPKTSSRYKIVKVGQ